MIARILVIEDDPDVTQVIRFALEEAGHQVLSASNGMTGLLMAREQHPDLILLDLGLPDFDGAQVARRLRMTCDVRILVLTAVDEMERKISLFKSGVEAYMTKPFHPEELVARVNGQLRRLEIREVAAVGPLEISAKTRQCSYLGQDLKLTGMEFSLVNFLAQQPGRVYSRDVIERELWPHQKPENNHTLDAHIANLRSKLRDLGGFGMIRTVRGIGYAIRSPR